MLVSRESTRRNLVLVAAAAVLAFALAFALPHAAWAFPDGGDALSAEQTGGGTGEGGTGSSDDTPSGGAGEQGGSQTGTQQGAGDAVLANGSEGNGGTESTSGAQGSAPSTLNTDFAEEAEANGPVDELDETEEPTATYTITFSDGVEPIIAVAGKDIVMPEAEKEGYTLKGWALADEPDVVKYEAGKAYSFTANTELVAVWEPKAEPTNIYSKYAELSDTDGTEGDESLSNSDDMTEDEIAAKLANAQRVMVKRESIGAEEALEETVPLMAAANKWGNYQGGLLSDGQSYWYFVPGYDDKGNALTGSDKNNGYGTLHIVGTDSKTSFSTLASSGEAGDGYPPWSYTAVDGSNAGNELGIVTLVKYVAFENHPRPVSIARWFCNADALESVSFKGLDLRVLESTRDVFSRADNLHSIDMSVEEGYEPSTTLWNMRAFIFQQENVRYLNMAGWDMGYVTNWEVNGNCGDITTLVAGPKNDLSHLGLNESQVWLASSVVDSKDGSIVEGQLYDVRQIEAMYKAGSSHFGKMGTVTWSFVNPYRFYFNGNENTGSGRDKSGNNVSFAQYGVFGVPSDTNPPNVVLPTGWEPDSVYYPGEGYTSGFYKEGYKLVGWKYNNMYWKAGEAISFTGAEAVKIFGTDNMIVYLDAQWEMLDGYTIRYDVAGGTPDYPEKSRNADGSLIKWDSVNLIPATEPTLLGCTFVGWFLSDGNGHFIDGSGAIKSDPTVRAEIGTSCGMLVVRPYSSDPIYLQAAWAETPHTMTYAVAKNGSAQVTDVGGSSESRKPISEGFRGATATVNAGYHALYWTNNLFARKTIPVTDAFRSFDENGVETVWLTQDLMKDIAFYSGEWHDCTFTLVTAGNQFTIHFEPNGAVEDKPIGDIHVTYGDDVYLPSTAGMYHKSGYNFGVWANAKSEAYANALGITYKTYDALSKFTDASVLDGATYTLYAIWNEHQSTIRFSADYPEGAVVWYDEDDGTELRRFQGPNTEDGWTQTIGSYTGALFTPTAVANAGYRFLYWIDGQTKSIASTEATWAPLQVGGAWPESAVYRAKFEPRSYTIAFDANTGTGSLAPQTVTYTRVATLKPNAVDTTTLLRSINRAGYSFAGWNTRADGKGTHYADQGTIDVDAAFLSRLGDDGQTVTLYAEWEARPMTVRYNAGAAGVDNPTAYIQSIAHETPFTLTANQFRRYGYVFAGWSRTFGGEKAFDNVEEGVVFNMLNDGAEVNLYALWERIVWKVFFNNEDATGGSFSFSDDVQFVNGALEVTHLDSVGVEPAVKPNAARVFMGWDWVTEVDALGNTKNGTVYAGDIAGFQVMGPTTFTATWGPAVYYVRYDPGKHGLFSNKSASYTYWAKVDSGSSFYPSTGQGGYLYNGGVDDATTNPYNIGKPLGEPGYMFEYWSWYDEDGVYRTTLTSAFPKTVKTSYVFLAHWAPSGSAVYFDANGGEPTADDSLDPIAVDIEDSITLPGAAAVARLGYYFAGWSTSKDGSIEYLGGDEFVMPGVTALLYAQWTPYKFTLHFDSMGGTAVDDAIGLTWDSQFLIKSQLDPAYYTARAEAADVVTTRPGYTFAGWFVDPDNMDEHLMVTNDDVLGVLFANSYTGDLLDGQDFTLYAKWAMNASKIHYLAVLESGIGGTSNNAGANAKVQENTVETVSAVDGEATEHYAVAGTGMKFLYWADKDGNILSYEAAFTPTKGAYDPDAGKFNIWDADTYIYAVFAKSFYKIVFDANGGDGAMEPMTKVVYDETKNLTANNGQIFRAGYRFLGWTTEPDGSGKSFADGAPVSKLTTDYDGEVVLYARWILLDHKLVFHSNLSPDTTVSWDVYAGEKLELHDGLSFARDHYNLLSWNTKQDGSGKEYALGADFTMPGIASSPHELHLYAQWRGISYTVRYVANALDATGKMADLTLYYDEQDRLDPVGFARQGYTFAGWTFDGSANTADYADADEVKNLAENDGEVVYLYALWAANDNIVSFENSDALGGTVSGTDQVVATGGYAQYEGAVTATANKSYQLAGWDYVIYADGSTTKVVDKGSVADPSTVLINGRTVFTAIWIAPYTVRYLPGSIGGFAGWTSEPQWAGAVIPAPPDSILTADGTPIAKSDEYLFVGWKGQNDITYATYEDIRNALKMTEEGWVFEAQWKRSSKVIVSFVGSDDNAGSVTAADQVVLIGARAKYDDNAVQLVTNAGYKFVGWNFAVYDEGSATKVIQSGTVMNPSTLVITGRTVFTAVWMRPYMVSYLPGTQGGFVAWSTQESDGADIPAPPDAIYDPATGAPLATGALYVFQGWKDQNGTIYANYAAIQAAGLKVTEAGWVFEAQWLGQSVVSFNSSDENAGTVTGADQIVLHGTYAIYDGAVTATAKDGFKLAAWKYVVYDNDDQTKVVGSGTVANPSTLKITGRTVFSALWMRPYMVTYLPGMYGGFDAWSSQLSEGAVVPGPDASVNDTDGKPKSGNVSYEFAGWKDQNGKVYADSAAIIAAGLKALEDGWVFEAQWKGIPATLTYNANGSSWRNRAPDVVKGLHGQTVTLLGGNSFWARDGYTFAGWSETSDGVVKYGPYAKFTLDKAGSTLYAQWTKNKYNVYYNMNGAPAIDNAIGVDWWETVGQPGEGWNDGSFYKDYVFVGWTSTLNAKKVILSGGTTTGNLIKNILKRGTGPQSVTLYAKWALREVTINYVAVGGHGTVAIVGQEGKTASASESFQTLNQSPRGATVTERTGYRFLGWYDKAADEEGAPATLLSTNAGYTPKLTADSRWESATYYAWFTPHIYTITFNANADDAATASAGMPDQDMAYDKWEALSARDLRIVRPGYTFSHWNTKTDGSGLSFSDGQVVFNLSSEDGAVIPLYAQWIAGDIHIVYHKGVNTAGGTMADQWITYGQNTNLTANAFWRNGYKFLGWATSDADSSVVYTDAQAFSMASGDPELRIDLYAVWDIADNYILRFENTTDGFGTITDDEKTGADALTRTVTYWKTPGVTGITVAPTEGYAFAGWKLVWYLHGENGRQEPTAEIVSRDAIGSINEWVVKGYETIATPVWEKMYRVTYKPGEHGAWTTGWAAAYALDKTAVATFGQGEDATALAGLLYTVDTGVVAKVATDSATDPATTVKITLPASADNDKWVFAGWESEDGKYFFSDWNDLKGLTFDGEDIVFVAKWATANPIIRYYWGVAQPEDQNLSNPHDATHKVNEAATLLDATQVTNPMYELVGYATKSGGPVVYLPGETIVMPRFIPSLDDEDSGVALKLYAVWKEHTVIVKYRIVSDCLDPKVMGTLAGNGLRMDADGVYFQEVGAASGNAYDENGNVISSGKPLPVYANPKAGYVFVAWVVADSPSAAEKSPSSPFTVQPDGTYQAATYWALFKEANVVTIEYLVGLEGVEDLGEDARVDDAGYVSLHEETVERTAGNVALGSIAVAKDGFKFAGWYRIDSDKSRVFVSGDPSFIPTIKSGDLWPEGTLSFIAMFKAEETMKYTVQHWLEGVDGTFAIGVGDDYTDVETGGYGKTVTANPKDFAGFTFDPTASSSTRSATLQGNEQTVLVLYYTRNRYTVTYEYTGVPKPNGAAVLPTSMTYRWGETVTPAPVPSVAGYTFTGWTPLTDAVPASLAAAAATSPVTVNPDGTFVMPQGNVVMRGVWAPVQVTLDYDPNGGAFATNEDGSYVDAVQPKVYPAGTPFTLPTAEHVSWAGRVLVGWSTDPNGPLEFTAGQGIYMPFGTDDVKRTMYAIWREQRVKVQFDQAVRTDDGEGGYTYEPLTGTLSNYDGGKLVVDGGRYSMMVGAVTGKVYGYYNTLKELAASPYQALAEAPAGYAFKGWMDEDGDLFAGNAVTWTDTDGTNHVGNVFTLAMGADGLYHAGVYTAVFEEADPVRVYFNLITDAGEAVNSGGTISLDPADMAKYYGAVAGLSGASYQSVRPVSGVPAEVKVVDTQDEQSPLYSFVGWYRAAFNADGTLANQADWVLVGTTLGVTPEKGASGLFEDSAYFAVFHYGMEGFAQYTVQHYLQLVDGSGYESKPSYTQKQWVAITTIDASATPMTIPGFTFNASKSDPATFTISQEGVSDVFVKLFYDRNLHKVSYAYAGDVPFGAPVLPADKTNVRFGETVTADRLGPLPGYTFIGWASTQAALATDDDGVQTFDMPDADVVLTGYFEAKTYHLSFVSDAAKATVSGSGAEQDVRFSSQVAMNDPATGLAWVVVTPAQDNDQVQYGWKYTMTDEDGNVLASDVWVLDPASLTVGGNMTFTANWTTPRTVKWLPGDSGAFTEGTGLTVFGGLTPADAILKKAGYNSDVAATGLPLGKPGYVFVAWQWADPETGVLLRSDAVPLPEFADVSYEFTAIWDMVEATLSFDVNGGTWAGADPNDPSGSGASGVVRTVNGTAALPGDPSDPAALATRTGYHIVGWGESANGPAQWLLGEDFTMPKANTTLFLVWEEDAGITIYYTTDGAGTVSLPTEQVSAISGGAAGSVATPKSGRVFQKWSLLDKDGNVLVDDLAVGNAIVPDATMLPDGIFTEGLTFKAFFEEGPAVTITYQVATLGLDGKPLVGTGALGGHVLAESETLSPVTGTAQGTTALAYAYYRLLYWVDENGNIVGIDNTTALVQAGSIMPLRNADGAYENVTYTAVFQLKDMVVVTFDGNIDANDPNDSVSNVPNGIRGEAGTTVDPSSWAQPSRPGYTFLGWSLSDNAPQPDTGLEKDSASWNMPAVNTKLYAVWEANADATVTLDAGDGLFGNGTNADTFVRPDGKVVNVSDMPQPTREGYTFLGWSETDGASAPDADGKAGTGLALGKTWVVKSATLHAVWQAKDDTKYVIEYYKVVNGSVASTPFDTYTGQGTTGTQVDAKAHAYTTGTLVVPAGYAMRAGDVKGAISGDGKLVLKLFFDATSQTLTLLPDGGTLAGGAADPSGAHFTDETVAVPAIEKPGFTLEKWVFSWIDGDGLKHSENLATTATSVTMPAYDAKLRAVWQVNNDTPYTIEYYKVIDGAVDATPFDTHADAGTTGAAVDAMANAYTQGLAAPTGYVLRAVQADAAGTIDGNGTTVLKVYFDAVAYTLSYNANGGTLVNVTSPVTAYAGQSIALPGDADVTAPAGKKLVGWFTSDKPGSGDVPYVTTFTMGTGNVELFAIWADNDPATVVLIAGEGLFGNGQNSESYGAPEGSSVAVNDMPTPTRAGYTFLGWTKTEGNPSADANLGTGQKWTVETTALYAVWQANTDTKYVIEYYKVVNGSVASTPFDTHEDKGTTGTQVDAEKHAYTTGTLVVPAGYALAAKQPDAVGAISGDGKLVLKLYYDAQPFTVSIDLDGGTLAASFKFDDQQDDGTTLTATYVTDSTVAVPNKGDIARAGYELLGWTVKYADNTTADVLPGGSFTMPAGAVSLKPIWKSTISDYTVNYVKRYPSGSGQADDIETTLNLTANTGDTVQLGTNFTQLPINGYTFWTGNTMSGVVKADGSLVINLYYLADDHKVSYDLNAAGAIAGTEPTWSHSPASTYTEDAWTGKFITIEGMGTGAPARAGYKFLGWALTAGATEAAAEYAPGTKVELAAADLSLFAVWQAFKVLLAFDGGNDEYIAETPVGGSKASINTEVGATVPLGDVDFTRPGYTFDGWYLSDDAGNPKTLFNGDFTVGPVATDGATMTLVAQWTPKEYTIVYKTRTNESGNASIVVANEKVRFNQIDDARLVKAVSLTGYNFLEWNTSTFALFGKKMEAGKDFSYLVGGDDTVQTVTLNCLWDPKKVKITFKKQNAVVAERTMAWNAKNIVKNVSGAAPGYKFEEWNTSVLSFLGTTVTATMTVGEMMGNDDSVLEKTLYAILTPYSYTIKYDAMGGLDVPQKTKVQWSTKNLVKQKTTKRDGFTFDGWWTKDGTSDGDWGFEVTNATRYYDLRDAGDDSVKDITLYAKWTALAAASAMSAASISTQASEPSSDGKQAQGAVQPSTPVLMAASAAGAPNAVTAPSESAMAEDMAVPAALASTAAPESAVANVAGSFVAPASAPALESSDTADSALSAKPELSVALVGNNLVESVIQAVTKASDGADDEGSTVVSGVIAQVRAAIEDN